jgi:hypothetical protein
VRTEGKSERGLGTGGILQLRTVERRCVVELVRNESTILLLHPLLFTFHLQVKSNGDGSILVISFFQ